VFNQDFFSFGGPAYTPYVIGLCTPPEFCVAVARLPPSGGVVPHVKAIFMNLLSVGLRTPGPGLPEGSRKRDILGSSKPTIEAWLPIFLLQALFTSVHGLLCGLPAGAGFGELIHYGPARRNTESVAVGLYSRSLRVRR